MPSLAPLPKLIGQYDSPFVRRVAIALTRYGVAYQHVPWSVWADADAIARYNPLRRVPTVVLEDGSVLIDSYAILDHFDEQVGPRRALLPRSGLERRAGLRAIAVATGAADKAVSLLYEHVLREGPMRSRIWADRCTAQIADALAWLEAERAARPSEFWFGAELGHADVAVACLLRFTCEALPAFETGLGPALRAHAERCEALPEFQAVCQPLRVELSR